LGTLDPPGVGLPFDAAVTPEGDELWVLNAASNDVTVIDLVTRQLTAHIEVGDNPRGIVLSPDGETAFVNNTLGGTVSVISTGSYSVTKTITTTQIPLPPLLLQGKKLFHSSDDPRMSNAQWIACSSCHFDGQHDGRTWIFSFAGPRNTTSLQGMIETYPLRWSGEWDESADGEFAVRRENFGSGLIDGEMHCDLFPANCVKPSPNQGLSADLDVLAAFMDSLTMPLSPGHRRGETLSPAETHGRDLYEEPDLGCVTCHPPPLYSDLLPHDVGTETAGELIGPAYDTPTLRGLHRSAPYFNDGSAATLVEALTRPSPGDEHNLAEHLSEQELNDLIRYLLALPYQ
jgi:YVTN family beta-propeller protein